MTVIAYRDGIMVGDSLEASERGIIVSQCRKVFRHANGWLSGASGDASDCNAFHQSIAAAPNAAFCANDSDFGGVAVSPDGEIFAFWGKGQHETVNAEFYSIGSGREIAMGAMAVGATALRAVSAAIEYSVWCGGDIHVVALDA